MEWILDINETSVEFLIKKFWGLVKVKGRMQVRQGMLNLNPSNLQQSSVYVEIDPDSAVTGNARRDAHLKTADFFDVARYPLITFRSSTIEQVDEAHLRVNGELTVRGISRIVTLDVTMTGDTSIAKPQFRASTTLLRKDFGLNFNKMPLGQDVLVNLEVKTLKSSSVLHPAKTR